MSNSIATILIPTFNRPYHLHRLLNYMSQNFNLEQITIIVLDGSDTDSLANKKTCSQLGIAYRHYGPNIPIFERWLDGIKSSSTKFTSFLADDDILQPEGYYNCVKFLHSYPEYAVVHGDYAWFSDQGKEAILYPGYQTFSLEHESPLERLFDFLADYVPLTYGVYRTEILTTAYEESIGTVDADNLHLFELLSGCIPVVLGKVKKLESSYYARNMGESAPRSPVIYPKIIFSETFYRQYANIKSVLKKLLSPHTDPQILDDAIDYCFGVYYGRILSRNVVSKYFTSLLSSNNR